MNASSRPSFVALGVAAEITEALAEAGITHAFAIQEYTLPIALKGSDVIGQARTGMGKTLGFGIPVLDRVFDDATVTAPDGTPRALIVVPTRELCLQVTDDLTLAAQNLRVPVGAEGASQRKNNKTRALQIQALYGGVGFEKQTAALARGVDVVVGTPGRLLDLARQGYLQLGAVEIVVLDEADEMLDQGFLDDVRDIITQTSDMRQTMLFSATMPGPIAALTRTLMLSLIHI